MSNCGPYRRYAAHKKHEEYLDWCRELKLDPRNEGVKGYWMSHQREMTRQITKWVAVPFTVGWFGLIAWVTIMSVFDSKEPVMVQAKPEVIMTPEAIAHRELNRQILELGR